MTNPLNSPVVSAAYTINGGGPQDLTVTAGRDGSVCLTFSTEDTIETHVLTPAEADALAAAIQSVRGVTTTPIAVGAPSGPGLTARIRAVLHEQGWITSMEAADLTEGLVVRSGPGAGRPVPRRRGAIALCQLTRQGDAVRVQAATSGPGGLTGIYALPDRVDECRAHFGITVEAA